MKRNLSFTVEKRFSSNWDGRLLSSRTWSELWRESVLACLLHTWTYKDICTWKDSNQKKNVWKRLESKFRENKDRTLIWRKFDEFWPFLLLWTEKTRAFVISSWTNYLNKKMPAPRSVAAACSSGLHVIQSIEDVLLKRVRVKFWPPSELLSL